MKPEMISLLHKAVEWATAEAAREDGQSHWNQDWVYQPATEACGSTYCIAGKIIALYHGVVNPYTALPHGVGGAIPYAMQLLDLTDIEADSIFASGLTIEQVRAAAESVMGEKL